jgi:hypothetical protein
VINQRWAKIAAAVSQHGLHKVSAHVMAQDGQRAPAEWTDAGVGLVLGTKIAADLLDRREIAAGLVSLAVLTRGSK